MPATTYTTNFGYVRAGGCDMDTVGVLAAAGHTGPAERLLDLMQAVRLVDKTILALMTPSKALFDRPALDCSDATHAALIAAHEQLSVAVRAYGAEKIADLVEVGALVEETDLERLIAP